MEKKLFTIGLVVILVFGTGYLGYFFAGKQALSQTGNTHDFDEFLDSELTKYFSALISGEVVSASGATLVIKSGESKSSFNVSEDAIFYRQPAEKLASAEEIKLEDLKPGDLVNISISFARNGKIGPLNVMLLQELPSPSPTE